MSQERGSVMPSKSWTVSKIAACCFLTLWQIRVKRLQYRLIVGLQTTNIFIIQKNDLNGKDYYVFKTDGSLFSDGKKYLEVGEYWKLSKNMDVIDHVSGWAGGDLLVTYTTRPDGSGSSAYWFVVGSRKFMQVREL
ncbi:MAG: hypothetical protein A2320_01220 [Pseudomonadales bacterium GWC2_63_15]|nr:MAG: hypothetical protein A2320_01220 [Pseudomonadales bacterium GWC2_63_15]